jgi:hypothetical protein
VFKSSNPRRGRQNPSERTQHRRVVLDDCRRCSAMGICTEGEMAGLTQYYEENSNASPIELETIQQHTNRELGSCGVPRSGRRSRAQSHRWCAKARWFRRGVVCSQGPPGLELQAADADSAAAVACITRATAATQTDKDNGIMDSGSSKRGVQATSSQATSSRPVPTSCGCSKGEGYSEYGNFVLTGSHFGPKELVPECWSPLRCETYHGTVWKLDILHERLEEVLSLAYVLATTDVTGDPPKLPTTSSARRVECDQKRAPLEATFDRPRDVLAADQRHHVSATCKIVGRRDWRGTQGTCEGTAIGGGPGHRHWLSGDPRHDQYHRGTPKRCALLSP